MTGITHKNDLRGVDLNLLVVLDALLEERHVSRAAAALGMSQPAVSHALARLRDQLGDPLLVRSSRALLPTALAQRLHPQVHALVASARDLLVPHRFDPATATGTVALSMSDYAAALFLPRIIPRLRREAPGVVVHVSQGSREGVAADLAAGRLDLALGVFPFTVEGLRHSTLLEEHFICVGDRTRWAAAAPHFDLQRYLDADHLQVSVGASRAEVDHALDQLGHTRRIVATVPHFTLAPDFIVGTDLLLTIASRMLRADDPRLLRLPLLVAVPAFPYVQAWHMRNQDAPLQGWLRALLTEVARDLCATTA